MPASPIAARMVIRLPQEALDAAREIAETEGVSTSALLGRAVVEWLTARGVKGLTTLRPTRGRPRKSVDNIPGA